MVFNRFLFISDLIGCQGGSACVRYPSLFSSILIGEYSPDPFVAAGKRDSYNLIFEVLLVFFIKLIKIIKEANGFKVSYPEGDNIINKFTNKTCRVSIDIDFDCDKDAIWTLPNATEPGHAPVPSEFYNVNKDTCKVDFYSLN